MCRQNCPPTTLSTYSAEFRKQYDAQCTGISPFPDCTNVSNACSCGLEILSQLAKISKPSYFAKLPGLMSASLSVYVTLMPLLPHAAISCGTRSAGLWWPLSPRNKISVRLGFMSAWETVCCCVPMFRMVADGVRVQWEKIPTIKIESKYLLFIVLGFTKLPKSLNHLIHEETIYYS